MVIKFAPLPLWQHYAKAPVGRQADTKDTEEVSFLPYPPHPESIIKCMFLTQKRVILLHKKLLFFGGFA